MPAFMYLFICMHVCAAFCMYVMLCISIQFREHALKDRNMHARMSLYMYVSAYICHDVFDFVIGDGNMHAVCLCVCMHLHTYATACGPKSTMTAYVYKFLYYN